MILSTDYLYRHWHDYFFIEAHADDPKYVWGLDKKFRDKSMSLAIKHLYELLRDTDHDWEVTISWVY